MQSQSLIHTIYLSMALVLLTSACNLNNSQNLSLTEQDAGKTIELRAGDELSVTLKGNPTTGYTWEMDAQQTAGLLQQVGETEFKPEGNAPGSGGQQTLRFKAITPGAMTLRLVYRRPWEQNIEPADSFEVKIVIR